MTLLLLAACSGDPAKGPSDTAAGEGDTAALDTADTGATDTSGDTDDSASTDTAGLDADGDGVTVADGDCDDARADVYPGAEEWCDLRDHDCDGEPLAEGVCGKEQHTESIEDATWVGVGRGESLGEPVPAGDLDGDGVDDLLLTASGASAFGGGGVVGAAFFVPGGALGWEVSNFDATAGYWVGEPARGDYVSQAFPAGDFDGDGAEDVWVLSRGCPPDNGAAYLIRGPATAWPATGAYLGDVAAGWWDEERDEECFGWDGDGGHDVTGDGLADAVVMTEGTAESGDDGSFSFLQGRADPPRGAVGEDEPSVYFRGTDGEQIYVGYVRFLDDLDGDGVAEVTFDTHFGHQVVSGADLPTLDGAFGGEVGTRVGEEDSSTPPTSIGDWDGDGLPDWGISGPYSDPEYTNEGRITILRAPDFAVSAQTVDDLQAGAFVGDMEDASLGGAATAIPDMDGDAQPELTSFLLMTSGRDGGWCVLPSTRFVPGGVQNARDVAWCQYAQQRVSLQMPGADVDGDGFTDLIFGFGGEAGLDGTDAVGRVHVVRGWDIPWDDPYYW